MTMNAYPDDITFLIVPGLRDHVEDHWQTHLQKELHAQNRRAVTVPPLEHDRLSRAAGVPVPLPSASRFSKKVMERTLMLGE